MVSCCVAVCFRRKPDDLLLSVAGEGSPDEFCMRNAHSRPLPSQSLCLVLPSAQAGPSFSLFYVSREAYRAKVCETHEEGDASEV